MPTYAYACTSCDHRFEVRQSFSDAALSECPECTGAVRKLFNTVGIVFKGSGFYATDSRSSSSASKPSSSGDKADAGSSAASATSSTASSTSTAGASAAGSGSAA